MRTIRNVALQAKDVPPADAEWLDIRRFALSFDEGEPWSSHDRCAAVLEGRLEPTLTDLRTCLLFEFRRWSHFGQQPEDRSLEFARKLLGKIREKVANREVD